LLEPGGDSRRIMVYIAARLPAGLAIDAPQDAFVHADNIYRQRALAGGGEYYVYAEMQPSPVQEKN